MSYHSDDVWGKATLGFGWAEAVAKHRLTCTDPDCRRGSPPAIAGGQATIAGAIRPPAAPREATATVKRMDLWGNVIDTYRTEAELWGIREEQATLDQRARDEARLRAWQANQ